MKIFKRHRHFHKPDRLAFLLMWALLQMQSLNDLRVNRKTSVRQNVQFWCVPLLDVTESNCFRPSNFEQEEWQRRTIKCSISFMWRDQITMNSCWLQQINYKRLQKVYFSFRWSWSTCKQWSLNKQCFITGWVNFKAFFCRNNTDV